MTHTRHKRILLKLSGEALASLNGFGLDISASVPIVRAISGVVALGVEIAIVVGGGNYMRGGRTDVNSDQSISVARATLDQVGMFATMMNALALRDMLLSVGLKAEALSAKAVDGVVEAAGSYQAKKLLNQGNVVIFAGGTGNPFVTTDSTASLRAIEIDADAILKATTVDGVFDKDPRKHKDAVKYNSISFDEVVEKELAVMDLAAFTQCRDFNIPICVFNLNDPQNLIKAVSGDNIGTWVS